MVDLGITSCDLFWSEILHPGPQILIPSITAPVPLVHSDHAYLVQPQPSRGIDEGAEGDEGGKI